MITETKQNHEVETVQSDAWTFIVFLRDGRSFVSPATYASENHARARIVDRERVFADLDPYYPMITGDAEWRWGEYSHSIPIPKYQS